MNLLKASMEDRQILMFPRLDWTWLDWTHSNQRKNDTENITKGRSQSNAKSLLLLMCVMPLIHLSIPMNRRMNHSESMTLHIQIFIYRYTNMMMLQLIDNSHGSYFCCCSHWCHGLTGPTTVKNYSLSVKWWQLVDQISVDTDLVWSKTFSHLYFKDDINFVVLGVLGVLGLGCVAIATEAIWFSSQH
jgi:hypothetical protein